MYEDFYFVGCGACSYLYSSVIRDVEKHFVGNPNIVFVSISADANVNLVKEAIKKGSYNSPLSLNLNTDGKGFNHDILKYYSIQSFPTTILINKSGQIVQYNTDEIQSKDGLIKEIDRLLKQ